LKISKEIKIGFIFAAGAFILVWGINFFKDRHLFSSNRTLYAVYKDIAGLTPANPIIVNGMKIGQIDDVYFTKDTTGKIVVRMIIDNKLIDIPRNSTARIITSDIMGARKMEIVLGNDYQHLAQQGDTLPSSVQTSILDVVSEQFAPIKEKAEYTIASLDSVLVVIKDIFNKKTQSDLQEAMSSLNSTIHSIEHATKQVDVWVAKDGKLNTIFGNIESISTNIRNNNDKITKVIKNFSDISDSLAKANFAATINNANQILSNANDIIAKINKGEGTMGLLMNNDSLYNGLSRSAADLDKLLKDLKENPKRYINFSLF
jgi:phospholipid/cholesterol/gamma-HCH transport system substrate-binding protein